jgi:hypothetical protein
MSSVSELTDNQLIMELAAVKKEKREFYLREKELDTEVDRRFKKALEDGKR